MNKKLHRTLSIVVPTIGRKLLDDTLKSVFEQTTLPDELIVFDNSGTQQVRSQSKWQSHPLISWYCSDQKKDIISSWNTAVSYTRSEYVYILGDDDILLPDFVSSIYHFLDQGYDMIYLPPLYMYKNGECLDPTSSFDISGEISSSEIVQQFSKGVDYPIFLGTQVFSKKAFEKINGFKPIIENALAMDHLFHLEISLEAKRIVFAETALWKYRYDADDWCGRISSAKTILRLGRQIKYFFSTVDKIVNLHDCLLQRSFYQHYLLQMILIAFPVYFSPLKYTAVLLICFFSYHSVRDNIFLFRSWFYLFRHRFIKAYLLKIKEKLL